MARYGTILLIYNSSDTDLQLVESILNGYGITFLTKENSIFFKTLSKKNRDEISSKLVSHGQEFVLFHNNNSDGDRIKGGKISRADRKTIKRFVIEQ